MRKILVVYYSLEGNTRLVAEEIAKTVGAEILELKPKKEIKSQGFMRYIWGGRQVVMGHKPELLPFEKKVEDYNFLFLGTPVWAFNYSPPVRTFLSQVNLTGKRVALFCCHEGSPFNTLDNMARALKGNEIIGKQDFFAPLKKDKEFILSQVRAWGKSML